MFKTQLFVWDGVDEKTGNVANNLKFGAKNI